jgi:hypothetical protein
VPVLTVSADVGTTCGQSHRHHHGSTTTVVYYLEVCLRPFVLSILLLLLELELAIDIVDVGLGLAALET